MVGRSKRTATIPSSSVALVDSGGRKWCATPTPTPMMEDSGSCGSDTVANERFEGALVDEGMPVGKSDLNEESEVEDEVEVEVEVEGEVLGWRDRRDRHSCVPDPRTVLARTLMPAHRSVPGVVTCLRGSFEASIASRAPTSRVGMR